MQEQPLPAENVLATYTHDLTALARQGRFAPLLRRENEVLRVFQVLARPRKYNPILIGEDSAARFAVVAEVTRRISGDDVPEFVRDRPSYRAQRVAALDLGALGAGTVQEEFEKRLRSVFAEIKQSEGQTLLFIDNFHMLVGGGEAAGQHVGACNVLAPALARGEVVILGTSTLDDYRKYIERDAALQRHFQEVIVREMAE
jgi:ATP-dependent Clp protease ATP-binding subunit ClpB